MRICIIGLGKIGLPLAVQCASSGQGVIGVDISRDVVDSVNSGIPPFSGELDLDNKLSEVVAKGLLEATTDIGVAVKNSSVVMVVVPLVVDRFSKPDFTIIDKVTETVGSALQKGTLVTYETTLPVGTTRNRFTTKLVELSGLVVGEELFVVHSPERVFSGRIFKDLRSYPKLVGGVDDASTQKGVDFYSSVLEFDKRPELSRPNGVWTMDSAEAAELAKLAETTYRNVNIGLANEFAEFAESQEIDIYQVIEASNSQPFSYIHQPGIAVGGHCIPVYPKFYLSTAPNSKIPLTAIEVNENVAERAVEKIRNRIDSLKGLRAVILGASYRGGVKETSFSGVYRISDALEKNEANVLVHDPLFENKELSNLGFKPYNFGEICDIAILQAEHNQYLKITPEDMPGIKLMYDGRNFLNSDNWESIDFLRIGGFTESK